MSVDFTKLSAAVRALEPTILTRFESVSSAGAEEPAVTPEAYDALQQALQQLASQQVEVVLRGGDPDALFIVEDELAAQVQSFLDEHPMEPRPAGDGLEAMYDSHDVLGWMNVVGAWLRSRPRHPGKWEPGPPARIPAGARVALLGDWGTGRYGAVICAATIERAAPAYDAVIHLGDVYYSGTPKEVQRNFLDRWPRVPGAVHRACNSNHEMYSGGFGYFDLTLPRFGQAASSFCLENDDYRLIGLDTGYKEGDLAGDQAAWTRELVLGAGTRRVVLLTHHQPFSLYERRNHTAMVDKLQPLFAEGRIFAWYWGHEHRCVVYERHPTLHVYGRCVGHSGFPYFRDKLASHPFEENADGSRWYRVCREGIPTARVLDGENPYVPGKPARYGPNGFVSLELTPTGVLERMHAADGTELLHGTLR